MSCADASRHLIRKRVRLAARDLRTHKRHPKPFGSGTSPLIVISPHRARKLARILVSTGATASRAKVSAMKRDLQILGEVVHPDGPRTKRRRGDESSPDPGTEDGHSSAVSGQKGRKEEGIGDVEKVVEQGTQLWQTIKDATDKECVTPLPWLHFARLQLPHSLTSTMALLLFVTESPLTEVARSLMISCDSLRKGCCPTTTSSSRIQ